MLHVYSEYYLDDIMLRNTEFELKVSTYSDKKEIYA